jgi:hypothetical protein
MTCTPVARNSRTQCITYHLSRRSAALFAFFTISRASCPAGIRIRESSWFVTDGELHGEGEGGALFAKYSSVGGLPTCERLGRVDRTSPCPGAFRPGRAQPAQPSSSFSLLLHFCDQGDVGREMYHSFASSALLPPPSLLRLLGPSPPRSRATRPVPRAASACTIGRSRASLHFPGAAPAGTR